MLQSTYTAYSQTKIADAILLLVENHVFKSVKKVM